MKKIIIIAIMLSLAVGSGLQASFAESTLNETNDLPLEQESMLEKPEEQFEDTVKEETIDVSQIDQTEGVFPEVHNEPLQVEEALLDNQSMHRDQIRSLPYATPYGIVPLEQYAKNTVMNEFGLPVNGGEVNWPLETIQIQAPATIERYINGKRWTPLRSPKLSNGDVVLFKGMGQYKGEKINVEWTFSDITTTSTLYPYIQTASEVVAIWNDPGNEVSYTQRVYTDSGTQINASILTDILIAQATELSVDTTSFQESFSKQRNETRILVEETNENVIFKRQSMDETVSIMTSGDVKFNIKGLIAPGAASTGIVPFSKSSVTQSPYGGPTITGLTNDIDLKAKYTVEQDLPLQGSPKFYPENYTLDIEVDELLSLSAADLKNVVIKDKAGKVLTTNFSLTLGLHHNILIKATNAQLQTLGAQQLVISLNLSVDKTSPDLLDYFTEPYLNIPLTALNNLSSNVAIGEAKVKLESIPSGTGVAQTVSEGSSTDDLILQHLVENLVSTKPGDTVSIVGFTERVEFLTIGETSIQVLIKSDSSGVQAKVSVPITVIKGVLTLEDVPDFLFFDQLKISAKQKNYYPTDRDVYGALTIKDTRYSKQKWTLKIAMSEQLTNHQTGNTLENVLIYQKTNGEKKTITSESIDIETHLNTTSESYDISSQWFNGTTWTSGFFLSVPPGNVEAADYYGIINWTLADVPANE